MNSNKIIDSGLFHKQGLWFKGVNVLLKFGQSLGAGPDLTKDEVIEAARRKTGLQDLGKDFWDEPLERLIKSMQTEARLHPLGKFISRQRLINTLSVRLRAEDCFKKYPEILEQEIYPVTMIIGLQRTGTTKLQRLLASDPDYRSLSSWEALNPAPIGGDISSGCKRIKKAKTSVRALKYLSPGFFAIHPVEYDAPEEDVLLLDVSFLSTTAEAIMHVPSYAEWLEQTDQSSAYAYLVKLLKLLQWQRPAKRWVLKTPHHMEFLGLAGQYIPDLHLVWPHRSIYESIPSFMSMLSYSRKLFSNHVDPKQIAQHWIPKNGLMLNRCMDFLESGKRTGITHIRYSQLVKDPLGVLERIYNDQGLAVSDDLKGTFEDSNRNNYQGKYGRHTYRLSDFGIDESYIDQYTWRYQQFINQKDF